MDNDAIETQQRYQVGYGHERVHAVGQVPYQCEVHHATHENGRYIDHAIALDPLSSFEILDGSFAVVAPSQDGRE